MLAGSLVFMLGLFLNKKFLIQLRWMVSNKQILNLFMFMLFMGIMSVLITSGHGNFDFSYTKNILSQIIQFIMIMLVMAFIFTNYQHRQNYIRYVSQLIIYSFIIQSLVELLAFSIPSIASIIHLTYTDKALTRLYDGYAGIRGVALTGSPGWGLAVGFGFAFIIYIKEYVIERKVTFLSVLYFSILVLGAFFAGRSAFAGVVVGSIFYMFSQGRIIEKIFKLTKAALMFASLLLIIYLASPGWVNSFIDKVFPFVFEFYYKYQATGIVQTGSTNRLLEMWQVHISEMTWLVGEGWFTDPHTGAYYQSTDVGYLRNLLFGGILWVLLVAIYNFILASGLSLKTTLLAKNEKLLIFFFIVYSSILELKAMTLGFNKYLFSIFFIYYITIIFEKNRRIFINENYNFCYYPYTQPT